ncbi:alpha/beta hydrolase [Actinomycetospora sp. TBRC 11914]|uniref:alpha/beta fold hydrolase n=1 Tax=Actinomycetospora sp. TBRC 11914 TaxID=2729387 RepID=UPI00289E6BA7|nr:alpha/beta hydrolase [Actinomycetospora sp. TBRC 11914]
MIQLPEPFEYRRIDADGTTIHTAVGGSGDPVLLLHGYPQTHLMWRHVAPALARDHTVVVPDLRGYGASDKPTPDPEDRAYAKRAMAADQLAVMRSLGFDRFALVGHDRGARVSHRLTLDHPDAVSRLAVLDIVPTRHVLTHVDLQLARGYFHWFLLSTGGDVPETLLAGAPEFWIRTMVERLLAPGSTIEPEVMDHYVAAFSDPAAIAGTTADYRAGATTDLADDEASYDAGARVDCPVLVLWGERSFVGKAYEPLEVWREYAADVRGTGLPVGHFLPEEAPDQVLAELRSFLG